jgi:hypothetical protein
MVLLVLREQPGPRLLYYLEPTKAWWQTFVSLVYLHHNVAIDAMRIAHAHRESHMHIATCAWRMQRAPYQ